MPFTSPNKRVDERPWKSKSIAAFQAAHPDEKIWITNFVKYLLKSGTDGRDYWNTAGTAVHPAFIHTAQQRKEQRKWTDKLLMGLLKYKERFEDETIFALVLQPETKPGSAITVDNVFNKLLEHMPRGLSTNPEFLLLAENFKEQFGGLLVNYQKGFLGRAGITLSDDEDDHSDDGSSVSEPMIIQSLPGSQNPAPFPTPVSPGPPPSPFDSDQQPIPPYTPFPEGSHHSGNLNIPQFSPPSTPPTSCKKDYNKSLIVTRGGMTTVSTINSAEGPSASHVITSQSTIRTVSLVRQNLTTDEIREIQELNTEILCNPDLFRIITENDTPSD